MGDSSISKGARIGGWIMSILPVLLLLMSASFKFIQGDEFVKGLEHMGWTPDTMKVLGVVEITSALMTLIPRTAVIGAILVTAYMGGAVATHVRVGDAFYIQVLVGVFVWGGLWLRDTRILQLIPITR